MNRRIFTRTGYKSGQMVKSILTQLILLLTISFSFGQKFGFKEVLEKSPKLISSFTVPNTANNFNRLLEKGITVKAVTTNWIYISTNAQTVNQLKLDKDISDFHFEFCPPMLMSDTARKHHFVDQVHAGNSPLNTSYTGKDVIVGLVDTGIDFTHPDFQTADGKSRVIRYWDQTMADDANSPQPYGYGFVWDSTAMNAGTCTSTDNHGHGSTVSGQAVGNGLANGQNKGMAPDATIIAVETDFTRPNWTLTVADACDYIFKVADSLGLPAVVNLSLGSYLGSHDGNDPAAEFIENLLDQKEGRIVVGAAGNSGNWGKYHAQHNVTSDTSFIWIKHNASASQGPTSRIIDMWSDTLDANYQIAIGVDSETPNWSFRGRTNFHPAMSALGGVIEDTIWNGTNRIGTVQIYQELEGANLNITVLAFIDSTSYRMRVETIGTGKWDGWTGTSNGLNDFYEDVPDVSTFPPIAHYIYPDSNQSIVSSWNCSEKVISTANMLNRKGHIDRNLNSYVHAQNVGELSLNSSKGPTRHGLIKPDITAAGDVSLCSMPMFYRTNPAYNTALDSTGWHARNGGTSMASPVVAGIAALYLERCPRSNYANFMNDIKTTAYTDSHTGLTPNNAFGAGKIHAFDALQELSIPPTPVISVYGNGTIESTPADQYQWYLDGTELIDDTNQVLFVTPPYGEYEVEIINQDGCVALSSPVQVSAGMNDTEILKNSIYPNPTSDHLSIEGYDDIQSVKAITINGQETELKKVSTSNYSLSNLKPGVYVVIVQTKTQNYRFKVVKK